MGRAAPRVRKNMTVELVVGPKPAKGHRPGYDVTLPDGKPLPASRNAAPFYASKSSVVPAARLIHRGLGVIATNVRRATYFKPRDSGLLFDWTLPLTENVTHIVEDNYDRFVKTGVAEAAPFSKRMDSSGTERRLPPVGVVADTANRLSGALKTARELATQDYSIAVPQFYYTTVLARNDTTGKKEKVYQGSLCLLLPLYFRAITDGPQLAATLRHSTGQMGGAEYTCSTVLHVEWAWGLARILVKPLVSWLRDAPDRPAQSPLPATPPAVPTPAAVAAAAAAAVPVQQAAGAAAATTPPVAAERVVGTLYKLGSAKHGFVRDNSSGKSVFVGASDCPGGVLPAKDATLSYIVGSSMVHGKEKPCAKNVQVVSTP